MRRLRSAIRILRYEGIRSLAVKTLNQMVGLLARHDPHMMVTGDEARLADFTRPLEIAAPARTGSPRARIAWVTSPPGRGSGGHHNMFRFIRFAEQAGHECTIYLYSNLGGPPSLDAARDTLRSDSAYPSDLKADIRVYDPAIGVGEVDAVFATGWETAYPVFMDPSRAKRFYFVQDFEPSFYALGTESLLAENTYRFGFHGITAGGWLAHKLRSEYGMSTDHFDFGVDSSLYRRTNTGPRNEVFFYARPVTPRRAFDFGVMALRHVAEARPDLTITMAGWDVSGWNIPFRYNNLAQVDISELNSIYNRAGAALVMSLSNMSLLPLELLSSGAIPVVNDALNNRMVSDNPFIEYAPPSPAAMGRRIVEVMERPDLAAHSAAAAASVSELTWARSGVQFVEAFERAMRG